jgi:N-acetylmuramoyl-L-alanine amidase
VFYPIYQREAYGGLYMRKALSFLFLVLLILSFISNSAYSKNVTVKVGGEELTYSGTLYNLELNGLWIPTKTPCIVLANVAYVPLKEVFQDYLGLTVGYDSQNGIAYVSSGSKKMEFSFSKQEIYQNGVKVEPQLPVASIDGNTMVPLSKTAGYFGYTVAVKPDNKTLTVQWNNKSENSAVVKDKAIEGTVDRITYYVEDGNEIILVSTKADEISREFVLKPMEGNPYYRLCVQFKNAYIDKPGSLDVYSGSVQQVRYAQVDDDLHTANMVVEIDHNPEYKVNTVREGILITILSNKADDNSDTGDKTSQPQITPEPTVIPETRPEPEPTAAPSPTPVPSSSETPSPTPVPEPDERIGNGPISYTMEGNDCVLTLDGVNLPVKLTENPGNYSIEYRDIEKTLQIIMPVLENYKTEILPGNDFFHGIITVKSGLRNEINIRIPGKDVLNYVVKPNGDSGTKIVFKTDAQSIENNIELPEPTPVPKPVQPEPTPSPKPEPTPTPTPAAPSSPEPTEPPSGSELTNRGDGDRSGTISFVCGIDKIIIETIALNDYKITRLGNPSRIVVDLPGNLVDSKRHDIPAGRLYTGISTEQSEKTTARIIVEVPDNIDWEAKKTGNMLSVIFKPTQIRNIVFHNDGTDAVLKIVSPGIRQKVEKNLANIKTENDIKNKHFTFIFPSEVINVGSGKMKVEDGLMKAVHTLSEAKNTYILIERERVDETYKIRYTNSDNEIEIVPSSKEDTAGLNNETGKTGTEPEITPAPEKSGMLVVLDAGHGGHDPGATQGKGEKWYNLDITLRVEKILKSKGVRVKLTRSSDIFVGLDERAEMANDWDADVFISIHNNSFWDKSTNGTMTFYYPTSYKGKEYATIIQNDLLKNLETNNLGLRSNNFVVLKNTKMPAVLVEIACLSNDSDRGKLDSEDFRQKAAESLAESILKIVN